MLSISSTVAALRHHQQRFLRQHSGQWPWWGNESRLSKWHQEPESCYLTGRIDMMNPSLSSWLPGYWLTQRAWVTPGSISRTTWIRASSKATQSGVAQEATRTSPETGPSFPYTGLVDRDPGICPAGRGAHAAREQGRTLGLSSPAWPTGCTGDRH